MNRLARLDEETARGIDNFQRIIAFRNILLHGYADVDDRLVWNIVTTYLAGLLNQVNHLLDS